MAFITINTGIVRTDTNAARVTPPNTTTRVPPEVSEAQTRALQKRVDPHRDLVAAPHKSTYGGY